MKLTIQAGSPGVVKVVSALLSNLGDAPNVGEHLHVARRSVHARTCERPENWARIPATPNLPRVTRVLAGRIVVERRSDLDGTPEGFDGRAVDAISQRRKIGVGGWGRRIPLDSPEQLVVRAQSIREQLRPITLDTDTDDAQPSVTVSFGSVLFRPGDDPEDALDQAAPR